LCRYSCTMYRIHCSEDWSASVHRWRNGNVPTHLDAI
jgi:DMSO/TMAO reductase YedYZ molybdopterin-dependent catalytic subunit